MMKPARLLLLWTLMMAFSVMDSMQQERKPVNQELLCDIFKGPTCVPECRCVPRVQCSLMPATPAPTATPRPKGGSAIELRADEVCEDSAEVCCPPANVVDDAANIDDFVPKVDNTATPAPTPAPPLDECGVVNHRGFGPRLWETTSPNETEAGQFPWMVAITESRGEIHDGFIAGGSLISPNVVITVAHRVHERTGRPRSLLARAGIWDLTANRSESPLEQQERTVVGVLIHPRYRHEAPFNDNVALLVLADPFELRPHIRTICLPNLHSLTRDHNCIVSGWGALKKGMGIVNKLKMIGLPLVDRTMCQSSLQKEMQTGFQLDPSYICAGGEPGRDACTGDGGSPLACPVAGTREHRYQLTGMVAWGIGCGKPIPAVYTNVAHFMDWIGRQLDEINSWNAP